ncbi:MAG: NUDIX hydrolase [Lachnospiraceae bacterium]|nr:NUDIX hydrolase [Lachnospiraceae bacterium]
MASNLCDEKNKWLDWAVEIQSLAQAGLAYTNNVYDIERYERLREISAEMLSYKTDIPVEKVKDLFCNETGYQTPKVDTRAAIFEDGKILLVHEKNGTWSLPGGWCDVNQSVAENTIKETWEEAGLHVKADRMIAVQDRNKHNLPIYAYGLVKIFIQCSVIDGAFMENIETTETKYFGREELPEPLAEEKTSKEQILMCFDAYNAEHWQVLFD